MNQTRSLNSLTQGLNVMKLCRLMYKIYWTDARQTKTVHSFPRFILSPLIPTVLRKNKFDVFKFMVGVYYFDAMHVVNTIILLSLIVIWSGIVCIYIVSWYRWQLKIYKTL